MKPSLHVFTNSTFYLSAPPPTFWWWLSRAQLDSAHVQMKLHLLVRWTLAINAINCSLQAPVQNPPCNMTSSSHISQPGAVCNSLTHSGCRSQFTWKKVGKQLLDIWRGLYNSVSTTTVLFVSFPFSFLLLLSFCYFLRITVPGFLLALVKSLLPFAGNQRIPGLKSVLC